MIFIHLGDLHIGKSLGDYSLIEDQAFILEEILKIAQNRQAQAIVIAGDIYDKPIPSESAVGVFDGFLKKCAKAGLSVFIISGNHDSDERLNFGSSLFSSRGIHICAKYQGTLSKFVFEDEYGPVNFYLLPFVKAPQVRHFHEGADIPDYDAALRYAIAQGDVDERLRNVIVSHQFVAGSSAPELGGSESPVVQNVGTLEVVGADAYEKFDYAALGHIHRSQKVGKESIRYPGSPLKYSLSEAGHEKSLTLVTLKEKGTVEIEEIPLVPRRDLRVLKGTIAQLTRPENITDPDDYIFVKLTEEEAVSDAMAILRACYPRTVSITYENLGDQEGYDSFPGEADRDFPQLISDFYAAVYGQEISSEELNIMLDTAKEAGVYEAD